MKGKTDVYDRICETRIVAILRGFDTSKAVPLVEALLEGGIAAVEVTMDTPGALRAVEEIQRRFGQTAAVGAGTVLDPETGRAALLAGAQFLVAPNLNPDVIRMGSRYNRLVMPGCFTPTEIQQAYEAGADIVKVFPAEAMGPEYFRQLKGPLSHTTLMATGGISCDNARAYRAAGADILGVGGSLVSAALVAEGRFAEISDYAAKLVAESR